LFAIIIFFLFYSPTLLILTRTRVVGAECCIKTAALFL
jgi:hypothetical protein